MHKPLEFHIRGISPLILHNGQLADPLNPIAKQLKELTGKKKKTDADHEAMAKVEFVGGLYLNDEGRPSVPGENLEAALAEAGAKQRLGKEFKAGIISDGIWPIDYDGPKDADALYALGKKFVDRRGAKVGMATVQRTRPIFRQWELKFTVNYLPELLNEKQVRDAVVTLGRIIGICDHTPKFGRFEVV